MQALLRSKKTCAATQIPQADNLLIQHLTQGVAVSAIRGLNLGAGVGENRQGGRCGQPAVVGMQEFLKLLTLIGQTVKAKVHCIEHDQHLHRARLSIRPIDRAKRLDRLRRTVIQNGEAALRQP